MTLNYETPPHAPAYLPFPIPYSGHFPFQPTNWPFMSTAPWEQDADQEYREREQPLTFVLIHGSWADASFWAGVAAELRKKGHIVYVPEYPGHGADPNKAVTHPMLSKSIADYIQSHNLHNIILVGHSFGGTLVQKVAELVPERLKRLVFINAFVLKDGERLVDEFPAPMLGTFEQLRKSSKDDTIMLPFPVYREQFSNLGSLPQVQSLYNKISPEPAGPLFEKLNLKKFYSLTVPRSYVHLTDDTALPLSNPDYGWHPQMSSRLGLFRLIQTPGDHMTTIQFEPKRIARKLYEAARD
ncbi:alpha/beta fold hydrolase [Paenibacillus aceris]|uniref:Pimeloyl-ACP methyl ester carboxylesterase n=1 Tax=Paenibacillus aceris TaxID=869555 RepID=A0ABS4I2I4_9BACL|nr:alpha/beta fold hydrolase [Paenibacillus aceris]MBP1964374.1 pimeloyl-ACP methyl ester carboxylesterase [Paenibacillus aceris]